MLIEQEAFKRGLNTKVLKNTRLNKALVLLLDPSLGYISFDIQDGCLQ